MGNLVLYSKRVVPKRLQASGYEFIYPEISEAFNCLRK